MQSYIKKLHSGEYDAPVPVVPSTSEAVKWYDAQAAAHLKKGSGLKTLVPVNVGVEALAQKIFDRVIFVDTEGFGTTEFGWVGFDPEPGVQGRHLTVDMSLQESTDHPGNFLKDKWISTDLGISSIKGLDGSYGSLVEIHRHRQVISGTMMSRDDVRRRSGTGFNRFIRELKAWATERAKEELLRKGSPLRTILPPKRDRFVAIKVPVWPGRPKKDKKIGQRMVIADLETGFAVRAFSTAPGVSDIPYVAGLRFEALINDKANDLNRKSATLVKPLLPTNSPETQWYDQQVADYMMKRGITIPKGSPVRTLLPSAVDLASYWNGPDFADVRGNLHLIDELLAVANKDYQAILLVGPSDSGKSMIARRMGALMGPLMPFQREEIEKTLVRANLVDFGQTPEAFRPFRAPHHSVTMRGLVGTGKDQKDQQPSETQLARHGVIFLDQANWHSKVQLVALAAKTEFAPTWVVLGINTEDFADTPAEIAKLEKIFEQSGGLRVLYAHTVPTEQLVDRTNKFRWPSTAELVKRLRPRSFGSPVRTILPKKRRLVDEAIEIFGDGPGKQLNWRSNVWLSVRDWTKLMQAATPRGYRSFQPTRVGDFLESFNNRNDLENEFDLLLQPAREYAVTVYIKGPRKMLEALRLEAVKGAMATEIDFKKDGTLRLWWD